MTFPVAPGTLLLFCQTELAFSLSPGVIVMFVAARAIRDGMRPAMAAAFGALFGNLLFFAASATAVGALLLSMREWFFVAQWFGAGYLLAMAAMLLFGKARPAQKADVGTEWYACAGMTEKAGMTGYNVVVVRCCL